MAQQVIRKTVSHWNRFISQKTCLHSVVKSQFIIREGRAWSKIVAISRSSLLLLCSSAEESQGNEISCQLLCAKISLSMGHLRNLIKVPFVIKAQEREFTVLPRSGEQSTLESSALSSARIVRLPPNYALGILRPDSKSDCHLSQTVVVRPAALPCPPSHPHHVWATNPSQPSLPRLVHTQMTFPQQAHKVTFYL